MYMYRYRRVTRNGNLIAYGIGDTGEVVGDSTKEEWTTMDNTVLLLVEKDKSIALTMTLQIARYTIVCITGY